MRLKLSAAAILFLTVSAAASAQGFGAKFKSFGDWTVYRSEDAITDERSCVAVMGKDGRVQLTDDSFSISLRGKGGVGGYTIRLDSDPAWEMKLPSDIEEKVGAFVLQDEDFDKVMKANRVRVRVLTVLSDLVDFDVDISQRAKILDVLKSKDCHGVA